MVPLEKEQAGDARRELTYLVNEHFIKDFGFLTHPFANLLPCLPVHLPPGFDHLHNVFPHHVLMNMT